ERLQRALDRWQRQTRSVPRLSSSRYAMAFVHSRTLVGRMIPKQEIIDAATRYGLLPNVVEKDYILGWLLAGISNHDAFRETWVFKGGTCLKKCFFETYRFSEDLDFTLKDEA